MNVEYLIGSRKDFYDFVNLITHQDRIAILSHIDLDGLVSALFMEEILEKNNFAVNFLEFLDIKQDMFKEIFVQLIDAGITKVFICDIGIDSIDVEGLEDLRREMDVFIIDHHPLNEDLVDKRNMIKTNSNDCTALTIFDLGKEEIDSEEWDWLVCAAIFSDFSYKKIDHLLYLQEVYPGISLENVSSSVPGINARKINSALVYYASNRLHVYQLVKERKMEEITEVYELIEEEINRLVDGFSFSAEHYPEKNLHFYEVESRFNLNSTICSIISKIRPGDSFIFMQRVSGGIIKISARNSARIRDMGLLMKSCVAGLEGASGGGHAPSAAAKIRVEDLDEFKRRLLD